MGEAGLIAAVQLNGGFHGLAFKALYSLQFLASVEDSLIEMYSWQWFESLVVFHSATDSASEGPNAGKPVE